MSVTPVGNRITKITRVKARKPLIDIETDGNHLFFANKMLTHNSAVGATEHNHSQIAGGISKINEADVYWSIIMTDAMRAQGEISFVFQKTRNSDGVGNTVHLKWDPKTLRILDQDGGNGLTFNKKPAKQLSDTMLDAPSGDGQSLLDLMS